VVFTDGACTQNGTPGAKAGIGVYVGPSDPRNVSRRIQGTQTNNAAELSAILEVFDIFQEELEADRELTIYSDSEYSINALTKWAVTWKRNGWNKKGGISNLELIQKGHELCQTYPKVSLVHVKAHTGGTDPLSLGNAEADALATASLLRESEETEEEEVVEAVDTEEEEVVEVEEVETVVYRKKGYLILTGDTEPIVYRKEGETRGPRVGVWGTTKSGKKKVVLDT
jgi:ribonuclease HI